MSLINCKEDSTKTDILMEEGDSSLEPGEVKTPPHGSESMKPNLSEEKNIKCSTPQYLPLVKSASKKETDKCAEKVRAILELDAIKRKEELERRKEQKSEFLSLQGKNKKKEQKRQKNTKEEIKIEACVDHIPDRNQEDSIKNLKHKKNIHEDHINSTRHITESFESMRSLSSAVSMPLLPPLDFVTPTTNVASNFSRGFTGINNTSSYRSYNPFVRTYRADFRHRGEDFHKHNRTRFPRYRSQYNSGVFNTPSEESCHSVLQPGILYSQLLWTKTKPSISYAYKIHDRHSFKNSEKTSDINISKKKKSKKSKEREESKKTQLSPKSRRKSSKRKKIRKIREALQLQPLKNSILANDEVSSMTIDNSESISSASTENSLTNVSNEKPIADSVVPSSTNASSRIINTSKPQILDMFASLTPPKQELPPIDGKSTSNSISNVQITNKLQEIQDRIGRLLDDDELKLEVIQATKEKLLKKSREHIGIGHSKKPSTKKCPSLNLPIDSISPNRSKSEDKLPGKLSKKRINETEFAHRSLTETKLKGKSFDIFGAAKDDVEKNTRGDRDSTLDDKSISVNLNSLNFKQKPIENTHFVKIVSDKLGNSLKDSPCVLSKSVTCTNNGSPDTDDYSDNWENDDDEMDLNSVFSNINQRTSKNVTNIDIESPSSSIMDSAESDSNSKIQSTTPKNSPPLQLCSSPKFRYDSKKIQRPNIVCQETNDMQLLYNQFMKSVENADIESDLKPNEKVSISKSNKEKESEQLSTSSTSYSSSSSSSSDSSVSSSGSSSTTSSSDSASEDSNDTDIIKNNDSNAACNTEKAIGKVSKRRSSDDGEKAKSLTATKDDSKPNVVRDLKKLENLEANLLRIQMMRANYDSADEISDELMKMEKLFLHEKNIILNKFMDSSANNSVKIEKESHSDLDTNSQPTVDSIQSATFARGQFVQSLQKLPNKDGIPEVSNIFSTNREVIKLTISPVKLPKTSAVFEVDNDIDNSKQAIDPPEKSNPTVKLPKPVKEVAIVKPIMETKESTSAHHQKRRRSPIISHHTLHSRSRSRRGRVRSLSVSPSRNSSGRCISPQRRSGFSKPTRYRNFERRSRSRSPSFSRQISRRSGDISPIPRKRRSLLNIDDRFRKHSPRRDSRSHSRSPCSPPNRHRGGRYSRSPLPFKPPSPPTDPNLSPTGSRRGSLSPERRSRSISRSPSNRTTSPSEKSYNSNRHRSLSPKHQLYKQNQPHHSSTSYYFNHSPNRISLDARINIVLNGPSSGNNENNNSIPAYEDYSHYGQYGPAAYMAIPGDSNSFYTNQYVHITNSGANGPPAHAIQQSYPNLRPVGTDESELFSSIQQHVNVNTSNFYYNRFGTQPFGYNQPSPLLKELPKATVAVQKGNVLEIVPCSDLQTGNVANNTQTDNETRIKKDSSNEEVIEENSGPNGEKNKRSILKALDGETNSLRSVFVSAPKKKQVNFEDGVFPNHNSDEEDRKVIEAKIRVKMRRLKKKHGMTPSCHNLFENKVRKEKHKGNSNKKDQQPPPPPHGFPSPSLEQPIYLRTHTPTPLLYFHFDGVVHSMYVSQMERPIPPRLLNPKCLTSSSIGIVTHHADSQSPLYMQSPITAVAPHSHTSKKDVLATFTRPNRNENLSPKVISSTSTLQQTGSPKINLKIYSPIENGNHTEISNVTLPSTSPNSIKGNTIHTISSGPIANHLLPKREDSPKAAVSTRTNISMGLLPAPITHPPMSQNTPIPSHTRIPVIGVPPTVVPKVMSAASEPYMPGFPPTMLQNPHPHHSLNQNYTVSPSIAQTSNPHMTVGVQPYFNPPIHRMHRPLPNYMGQQNQPSPSSSNLPICHLVDPVQTANSDLDKFTSPQTMAIPFNFKGP
nr:serine-rich adhesin for platelets [Bactrocera oleae]